MTIWNFIYAINHRKKLDDLTFKYTMRVKLALMPFYIINFFLGIVFLIGGIIVVVAFAPMVIVALLMACFAYVVMISTSIYNVVFMFRERKNFDPFLITINMILHFIFVLDLASTIFMYNHVKNKEITWIS